MAVFDQRKKEIVLCLQSDEPDLSPKGAPDAEILELLELINSHNDFVSTSSCSGRAVVFLDSDKAANDDDAKGRWLMNRHSPLDEPSDGWDMKNLLGLLFGDAKIGHDWGQGKERQRRLVTLKFEPLIVHVLCRDISAASNLLHVAVSCGYRESGISVSGFGSLQEKAIVAIRTTAIRTEIPLASYPSDTFEIRPFNLTHEYLMNLISIVNERFFENNLRKEKLQGHLRLLFNTQETHSANETKEERRNRKRLEGLQIQAAQRSSQSEFVEHNKSPKLDILSDDVRLDQLITL